MNTSLKPEDELNKENTTKFLNLIQKNKEYEINEKINMLINLCIQNNNNATALNTTPNMEIPTPIQPSQNSERNIFILQPINDNLVNQLIPTLIHLKNNNDEPITIYLNSSNGDPQAADTLIKLLKTPNHKDQTCKIITVALTTATGAAANILNQGDYIIAFPNATIQYPEQPREPLQLVENITINFLSQFFDQLALQSQTNKPPTLLSLVTTQIKNPKLQAAITAHKNRIKTLEPEQKKHLDKITAYTISKTTKKFNEIEEPDMQAIWLFFLNICLELQKEKFIFSATEALQFKLVDKIPGLKRSNP